MNGEYDEENNWICPCGRSVEEMGFSMRYHYSIEWTSLGERIYEYNDMLKEMKSDLSEFIIARFPSPT